MVDKEEIEMVNNEVETGEVNKEEAGNYFKDNKIIDAVDEDTIAEKHEDGIVKDQDGKVVKFIKRVLATTMDQIISLALALGLLLLFDGILKLTGFYIVSRQPMFLIMYVIANILYTPICESTKLKGTIGKKTILK